MKHRIPLRHQLAHDLRATIFGTIPGNSLNRITDLGKSRLGALAALVWLALVSAPAWAQCNTTATTTFSFTDNNPARPAGENWNGHLPTGVPEPLGTTQVSSSVLTGANVTSSLVVNTPGNVKTLTWTSDFSAATGFVNVTFNFNRPLSNFKVNLSNINISRKTVTLLEAV